MTAGDDFTYAAYGRYLAQAVDGGYTFVDFPSIARGAPWPPRAILLRHDIDFGLRWIEPLAKIEHAHGVRSTYCLQPDSQNYTLYSDEGDATLARLLELDHWIGLHFDATQVASDDDVLRRVREEAERLGARAGIEVETVSFHMPTRRPVRHLALPAPLVNTYADVFASDITYVSDSNQNWRGADLAGILASGEHPRLQLLIHPMWWRDRYSPMIDKLRELADARHVPLSELVTPEQQALLAVD